MNKHLMLAAGLVSASAGCILEDPFNKPYAVQVGTVQVFRDYDTTPFYEAPDVSIVVDINNTYIIVTDEVQDNWNPSFSDASSLTIPEGSTMQVGAFDGDAGSFEIIIECSWPSLSSDILIDGIATCEDSNARIDVLFTEL